MRNATTGWRHWTTVQRRVRAHFHRLRLRLLPQVLATWRRVRASQSHVRRARLCAAMRTWLAGTQRRRHARLSEDIAVRWRRWRLLRAGVVALTSRRHWMQLRDRAVYTGHRGAVQRCWKRCVARVSLHCCSLSLCLQLDAIRLRCSLGTCRHLRC